MLKWVSKLEGQLKISPKKDFKLLATSTTLQTLSLKPFVCSRDVTLAILQPKFEFPSGNQPAFKR